MSIKCGDLVSRKSHGCDVIFKVCHIEENRDEGITAVLKGVNVRLLADSPISDLVKVSQEEVNKDREAFVRKEKRSDKRKITKKGGRLSRQDSNIFSQPGKVLHYDQFA